MLNLIVGVVTCSHHLDGAKVRILTIFAHPAPESFCSAVHERLVRELITNGHEVHQIDLYALDFDPVLGAEEWRRYLRKGANTEGIEEHLAQVRWAQAMIFVYPTWWYSLPAILKGWLERVLVPYETFELCTGVTPIRGRLSNINLIGGISTYGSPWWWIQYVARDPGRRVIMRGLRPLCAKRCRSFWLGLYHIDAASETQRQAFLQRIEALAARLG